MELRAGGSVAGDWQAKHLAGTGLNSLVAVGACGLEAPNTVIDSPLVSVAGTVVAAAVQPKSRYSTRPCSHCLS